MTSIREAWSALLKKRLDRLAQHDRHGVAGEKLAEAILDQLGRLEDLKRGS